MKKQKTDKKDLYLWYFTVASSTLVTLIFLALGLSNQ